MHIVFMKSKNDKISGIYLVKYLIDYYLIYYLNILSLFHHILAYTIHGKIQRKSYKNKKYKISALTWNKKLELLEGWYSPSDTQDYF